MNPLAIPEELVPCLVYLAPLEGRLYVRVYPMVYITLATSII